MANPLLSLLISRDKRLKKMAPQGNALTRQAQNDNAPEGSVGAPSGNQPVPSQGQDRDPAGSLLNAAAMLPGAGDVLGPIADIRNFVVNPKSRTLGNAALFAMGTLPAIPSLAYMMSRGGDAANPLARMAAAKGQGGIVGYHGSPHKFDKFDMSKIGTGEGAQAYGHGLYFAESPEVAKGYRDTLARPSGVKVHGEFKTKLDDAEALAAGGLGYSKGDYEAAIKDLDEVLRPNVPDDVYKKARSLLESRAIEHGGVGNLYHVDIPDDQIEKMLDWDAILSDQPEAVQDLAKMYGIKGKDGADAYGRDVLKEIERRAGGPRGAQEFLRNNGIPGVRYWDAGSRGMGGQDGGGTRNFVLFDDSIPKILKRE